MKKYLFIALLIPNLASAAVEKNMQYGAKGEQVIQLQEFLIDNGFLFTEPTGSFFSLTRRAVKEYQKSKGIAPTGFVGPITRAAMNKDMETSQIAGMGGIIELPETVVAPVLETPVVQPVQPTIQYVFQRQTQPTQEVTKPKSMKELTVTKTLSEIFTYSDGGNYQEILFVASYTEDGVKPVRWKLEYSSPELPAFDGAGIHNCERESACTDSKGITIKESGTYNFVFKVVAEDGTVTTKTISQTITL